MLDMDMIGYAAIASRMSNSSDLTLLRSFSSLNYQNILYLQAELTHIEQLWREKKVEIQNSTNEDMRERSPHDWAEL